MDAKKSMMAMLMILVFMASAILGYNVHMAQELTKKATQPSQTIIQRPATNTSQNSQKIEGGGSMPGFTVTVINDPGHQPRYRGYLNGRVCYVYEVYNEDASFTGCYVYVVDMDGDGDPDTEYYSTIPPV